MHCQHMKRCKCEVVSCGRRIERSVNIKKDVPYVPKRMRYFFLSLVIVPVIGSVRTYIRHMHADAGNYEYTYLLCMIKKL